MEVVELTSKATVNSVIWLYFDGVDIELLQECLSIAQVSVARANKNSKTVDDIKLLKADINNQLKSHANQNTHR